ncbi:tyrosine-protein phosphatase [Alkalicaulis satelles]|uniref:Tyrosine-protein phosphatase n=1 Tax=Alkalicaulis satelles TaxID=2609175 RepID=A0A5M6ZA40_9PROT|nr:tyrosine-protein phosphatase [Alkalicaulis satelles]KAA5801556.1 tyrosine-protein phosphatase [Alkalicaulis satelles]
MTQRVLPLSGVHNFRRFGAYRADGGHVADRLYRSGQFSRATPDDQARLDALNIQVVADLRRPRERELEPSFWVQREAVRVLASDHAGHAEPPHLVFLRESDMSLASIRQFMTETYKRLPFDPGNKAVFRAGFEALAEADDEAGFVVHCAAGKDRTGIFCAFLLMELGVDADTAREDYLMTNTAVDYDTLAPMVQARIQKDLGKRVGDREMRAFLGVEEAYLDAAMEAVGDVSAYLRGELALSEATLDAVKARLIAP